MGEGYDSRNRPISRKIERRLGGGEEDIERCFRKITEEEAENKKDGWEIGWICVV